MPVWLDAIPEKAPRVIRPNTRLWLIFLALIMLTGLVLTFWNWTDERSGFVFWFTAVGLPFCLWGLLFSVRRFGYKAEQRGTESRNIEREILIENEIRRGQRCGWILGTAVQTLAGKDTAKLLKAMSLSTPVMTLTQPRGGHSPVRYAALPDFQDNLAAALPLVISKIAARIQDIVAGLPDGVPCWLMIECDEEISALVEEPIKRELMDKTGRVFRNVSGSGLAAFDDWLDKRHGTPSLFIAITLALPSTPQEGDADAITAVVLGNRKASKFPGAIRLHRPEKGECETLTKTFARSLLWAALPAEAIKGAWITGPEITSGSGWNNACEENKATFSLTKDNHGTDAILGYAGHAGPWIAIAMADSACAAHGAQVITAQPHRGKDEIWVVVLSKQEALKETQGNV